MKAKVIGFVLSNVLLWNVFSTLCTYSQNQGYRIKTVTLDAGHGGKDPGTIGKHYKEKDIALAITLKLGAMISEKFPHIKVVYTRKTDEFVELDERANICNRNKSDLFICIHCNASENKKMVGTETYTMGLHKSESNLLVAMRENAVILKEENYQKKYGGYDPNSPVAHIMFNLYQSAHIERSLAFASHVEHCFGKEGIGRESRGVKQAGFLVLWRTNAPSVLIETGFLSNPEEEKYLGSEKGQQEIAKAIFKAFCKYKEEVEQ
ncbi:MAG: N-acetylmuramoyl-L-alanine amidase [Bacteroidia bacterium]|nr:N-acetylmuramoyl-L-alanine amidase [Bacteroidia bacterium]MDW8302518.1 N-acetylmuramoyl-L-alanine amidase [Bacteroidia bacterium]